MLEGWGAEPAYTGDRNEVQLFLKDADGEAITDPARVHLDVVVNFGGEQSAPPPRCLAFPATRAKRSPHGADGAYVPAYELPRSSQTDDRFVAARATDKRR